MKKARFNLAKPAITVAAAGFGAAVGGPLGGALGTWLGSSMGDAAEGLIGSYAEEFGKDAGKKLLETGADSLIEKLKNEAPDLEAAYRDTLRISLIAIRPAYGLGYEDWFANWDLALSTPGPLHLPSIQPNELKPEKIREIIRRTLEDLDAQGDQFRRKSFSFNQTRRTIPAPLFSDIEKHLPQRLQENFRILIATSDYEAAWREAQTAFSALALASLKRIKETILNISRKPTSSPRSPNKSPPQTRASSKYVASLKTPSRHKSPNLLPPTPAVTISSRPSSRRAASSTKTRGR